MPVTVFPPNEIVIDKARILHEVRSEEREVVDDVATFVDKQLKTFLGYIKQPHIP